MLATDPCIHARLAQANTWIFDLDNTLYPPSDDLFGQINRLMTAFIVQEVGVDEAEAHRLRVTYWEEYGNTLAGLAARHDVSAADFLRATHQLDLSHLRQDPALRAAIAALPGRLLVHTNGPRAHAEAVLVARGLDGLFHRIVAIEDSGLVPKPQSLAYDAFLDLTGAEPEQCVMIEDHADNLCEPHRRGMVTVWLDHGSDTTKPDHVDIQTQDVHRFLEDLHNLSARQSG
ncbi:MAG: pyrimidine 5'-nucleotidase [Pseudomonadota bacterium]